MKSNVHRNSYITNIKKRKGNNSDTKKGNNYVTSYVNKDSNFVYSNIGNINNSKTNGYHRFFAPLKFGEDGVSKNENLFSSKNTFYSSYFRFFSNVLSFLFLLEKPHYVAGKKNFRKQYHLMAILQPIASFIDFEKNQFFFENPFFFSYKTQSSDRFQEIYYLRRTLRQVCDLYRF